MAAWRQDLTHTIRRLSKAPGFVFAVMVSIGLGIAANATIFSMVSRFVLRPAPIGDPSTLMSLHTTYHEQCCNHFPWPVYRDLRDQSQSFSATGGRFPTAVRTTVRGLPLIPMPRRGEVQIVVPENLTGHLYARMSCGCKINL
jgi:hypothetical protein